METDQWRHGCNQQGPEVTGSGDNEDETERRAASLGDSCSIDRLSDDELGHILRRVRSTVARKACSQVSKRWFRLEGLTRASLRILDPHLLHQFLPRFPSLVCLEGRRGLCDGDLALIARTCSNLQTLVLTLPKSRDLVCLNFSEEYEYDAVSDNGISVLASGCPGLQRISLRWRQNVGDVGVAAIGRFCTSLTYLDISMCNKVSDTGLLAIADAVSLQSLLLKGCAKVTDVGLAYLASGKACLSLRKLDLSECDQITDRGMESIRKMTSMQVLYLSECGPRITDTGGVLLALICTLQKLNLAWLINISDTTILAIADHCVDLKELVLTGCELVTGLGVRRFFHHKALQALTLAACYNIYGEDVEEIANRCSTLEFLGLDRGLRQWIPTDSLKAIERKCKIEWI
ncbi:hypothetical protein KP509_09G021900 [Ceratopteris richardii]|uniref:F-box/LRR-repeat protein 15-like leucin rich repeat domain-containing protein n=1 Tax=Ceratopteris richardii TaxID=49495 RepID=A0A8T2U2X1_CERRI|nr:hypothetical protein KP509_09G021900 [Ceratopteris richardii]